MSTHQSPYKGARVERRTSGLIPSGPWQDRRVTFTLWTGHKSHGFRSDYQALPCRWYTLKVEGERLQCWTYTGKRYAKGLEHYDRNTADFSDACRKLGATDLADDAEALRECAQTCGGEE